MCFQSRKDQSMPRAATSEFPTGDDDADLPQPTEKKKPIEKWVNTRLASDRVHRHNY